MIAQNSGLSGSPPQPPTNRPEPHETQRQTPHNPTTHDLLKLHAPNLEDNPAQWPSVARVIHHRILNRPHLSRRLTGAEQSALRRIREGGD